MSESGFYVLTAPPCASPPSRTRLLGDLICKRRDGGMSLNERRANVRLPKGSLWPWPRARERAEDRRYVRLRRCKWLSRFPLQFRGACRGVRRWPRDHSPVPYHEADDDAMEMSEGWVVMTGRTVYSGAARVCFKQRNGTPLSVGLLWPVDERGPQDAARACNRDVASGGADKWNSWGIAARDFLPLSQHD